MIDIDALKRDKRPQSSTLVHALIDRLEAAEKDVAIKEEVIDSLAAVVKRLDAQCDAAEKERDDFAQQLVQSEIGKREISEAHDALQVEVGKLKDLEVSRCVKINGYIVDNARLAEEVERLRAKIEQMEKQTPRESIERMLTQLMDIAVYNGANSISMPDEYVEVAAWLCGIPTQPAPNINEGVRKVTIDFRWESEAQHHIPTIEIEFDPVSPDSPNDAKGWQDRDRIASMLSPEAKP